jgi:ComF family protein
VRRVGTSTEPASELQGGPACHTRGQPDSTTSPHERGVPLSPVRPSVGSPLAVADLMARMLDLIAPRSCPLCDAPAAQLCAQCVKLLLPTERRLIEGAPLVAAAGYGPPLSGALQRLKYQGRHDHAAPLAQLLVEPAYRLASCLGSEEAPVIVPVPLHPIRLAERGYNQSLLVATALCRELHWPLRPGWLRRVRSTPRQVGRDRASRLVAMAGAFVAVVPPGEARRLVLVLDDVITTGTTLGACLSAFRKAGLDHLGALGVAAASPEAPGTRKAGPIADK